jgi:hypothetical protein
MGVYWFSIVERVAPLCLCPRETGISALHKILSPDLDAPSDGSTLISFLPIRRVDGRGRGVEGTTDGSLKLDSNLKITSSQCSTLVLSLERRLYPWAPVISQKK